jgi:hypothetical protein
MFSHFRTRPRLCPVHVNYPPPIQYVQAIKDCPEDGKMIQCWYGSSASPSAVRIGQSLISDGKKPSSRLGTYAINQAGARAWVSHPFLYSSLPLLRFKRTLIHCRTAPSPCRALIVRARARFWRKDGVQRLQMTTHTTTA